MIKHINNKGLIVLCIGFFSILIFTPVHAADSPLRQIKSVIQQQLAAFNAEDYDAAYQYASKDIQSAFSRVEFEAMVRSGFPQIAHSLKSSFGKIELAEDGTHAEALVHVTGENHVTVLARYMLVLEEEGWKNNGVIILEHIMPV